MTELARHGDTEHLAHGSTQNGKAVADDNVLPGNGHADYYGKDSDVVPDCGVLGFKPALLQPCANIAVFTGVYSLSALITSTLFTYVNSQVTCGHQYQRKEW